ncbi:MAG: RluA family pseudouridine synthase [Patescibacteria group bacterium]|nr:RluA family pseudouridine synthase [bacterium]MDZ4240998.1 RluA family pseudouridine synthase [Patescibacteria group bacterium]
MEIPVLYEDDDIVAINKPAGLIVHSDGKTEEYSVAQWAAERYPGIELVGEPTMLSSGKTVLRPGIVHRLDRETSGVLLVAKTKESFLHLKRQFKNRKVAKVYHFFVYGEIKKEDGMINLPIGRSSTDFRKRTAERGARGELREAVTYYRVLKHNPEFTFIEARPQTGRTHQIRVHFKAISRPIVCDRLYAPKLPPILGFNRLALHAKSLSFTGLKGKKITLEAPYPSDFQTAVESL